MTMRQIDRFLPAYGVNEIHAITIDATPEAVYRAIRSLDFASSPIIRSLFRLRGLPAAAIRLERLLESGFILLVDEPGKGLVLGLLGRFWRPSGQLISIAAHDFAAAAPAGCAKAVWDFTIERLPSGQVRLSTETRVACLDGRSRKRFMLYWRLIAPFSAWIRREMLRAVKDRVETEACSGPCVARRPGA
jgi:hypothetical protein